jgi:hypothetical protein
MFKYLNIFHFRHPLIKRHLFENISCYVFMSCLPPAASVFCVARMDIDVVLLSCVYVPHWYVCFYAAFVYGCQITRKTLTPQEEGSA